MPSRVEGFGLVILEAMLQQSVVIGFHDCYGPEFLIDNEVNGYLIDKNDIISFSNRLTHIMQNYEDSNIQNIINHAERKVKEFDENIIYTQFIKDIEEIK
ncbi:glycosyltransferase [Mammaliicoccus lentus]